MPRGSEDTDKVLFTAIESQIQTYNDREFSFESMLGGSPTDAEAFNILTVIRGIRPAMLFQGRENESDEQREEDTKSLQNHTKNLSISLQRLFDTYKLDVQTMYDSGDFFVIRKDLVNQYKALKVKTKILGLCPIESHEEGIVYVFFFNGNRFMGNGCTPEDGLAAFAKSYTMFTEMKALATKVGGKVELTVDFA